MQYINEMREGDNVLGHYLCKDKQQFKSKAGKPYISLKIQDKTGVADAKIWDVNSPDIKDFQTNTFIKIMGNVVIFNNNIQINIRKLRPSEEGEYFPMDYIPTTERDVNEMYDELDKFIDSVKNAYLNKLLKEIFYNNEDVKKSFATHSAAKNIHHNYLGGLMEHTLNVAEICEFMSGRFKNVNRDLLITAALLHDIGKVRELSDFPVNDYTEEGQLLGHIYMGAEMVAETAAKIDGFPKDMELLLKHCILAHHGSYEFGSPKLPRLIEAYILHCVDSMDALTKVFDESLENNENSGLWTSYSRLFQGTLRKSEF
ncbi:MAG: HD domain-containing protein [Firmicutes bacterium]|nr:HD domain-containing protein [Bacillota bacterium]MBQ7241503.1 HD domain-containing protein [Bacillota bacterium]